MSPRPGVSLQRAHRPLRAVDPTLPCFSCTLPVLLVAHPCGARLCPPVLQWGLPRDFSGNLCEFSLQLAGCVSTSLLFVERTR